MTIMQPVVHKGSHTISRKGQIFNLHILWKKDTVKVNRLVVERQSVLHTDIDAHTAIGNRTMKMSAGARKNPRQERPAVTIPMGMKRLSLTFCVAYPPHHNHINTINGHWLHLTI